MKRLLPLLALVAVLAPLALAQDFREAKKQFNAAFRKEVPPEERGTDLGAVAEGYVSITPIHLDLTEHSLLDELRTWEGKLAEPA